MRPNTMRRELFRHAKVEAPRVLDIGKRLSRIAKLRPQLKSGPGRERTAWAKRHLSSADHVGGLDALRLNVLDEIDQSAIPLGHLPTQTVITDKGRFKAALAEEANQVAAAKKAVATSLFAAMVVADTRLIDQLSRTLQVLDALPDLPNTGTARTYAPVVLTRHIISPETKTAKANDRIINAAPQDEEPAEVLLAWDLANEYRQWAQRQLDQRTAALAARRFAFDPPLLPRHFTEKTRANRMKEARHSQYVAYTAARKTERAAISETHAALRTNSPSELLTRMASDADFATAMKAAHGLDIAAIARGGAEKMAGHLTRSFCSAYKAARTKADEACRPVGNGCSPVIDNPCVQAFATDRRRIAGQDDVRLLGVAQLITVEEEFMGYTPGEISAIESMLKGEHRKKEVKTSKYFEEISEDTTVTTEEKEAETTTTTQQELTNQIEQEISTRFSSDINAEASGEAGGTIGVVNFEGGASLGSNVGVGIDSSISQSSADSFSQEIVARALERTKAVTTKLRRQRSYRLFETTILNEFDNRLPGATSYNAIYCYLDKDVCIKERVYGLRQFMGAEVMLPGVAVLEQEFRRHAVDLADQGRVPDFDLTPAGVTPENYLSLVGKYRAANVLPPPPVMQMESRTYKTDTASEARMPEKGMIEKTADLLAPFFGDYKRYLIQDQIEVPEGYRVQEVEMTFSHGKNGISIPAHLPFSVLGAALSAGPGLGMAAIPPYTFYYLPIAVWQMLYTASPLMHVHADSSHVTAMIGHETYESEYFFFDPEAMLRDVLEALEASTTLDTGIFERLQTHMQELFNVWGDPDEPGSLANVIAQMDDDVQAYFDAIKSLLDGIIARIPFVGGGDDDQDPPDDGALPPFPSLDVFQNLDLSAFADLPAAVMQPFQNLFTAVIGELRTLLDDVLGDVFGFLEEQTQNIDYNLFGAVSGITGSIPVSLNVVALKPGVTVNLTACMVRIDDEALNLWRLETFERLSQAHAQLEAEHAAVAASRVDRPVMRGNPTVMRAEDRAALKTRLIDLIHRKYSATADQPITLNELRLFEHVFDWLNMTYRLFAYGPQGYQVAYEAMGLYATADARRRAFLDASWAKVMLPLQDDKRLEQVLLIYMKTGTVDFEADLLAQIGEGDAAYDELTAIYRDLVLRRNTEPGTVISARKEKIPTDLIVIHEGTPEDPYPSSDVVCAPDPVPEEEPDQPAAEEVGRPPLIR